VLSGEKNVINVMPKDKYDMKILVLYNGYKLIIFGQALSVTLRVARA
jgi:hypothetical protein